MRQSGFPCATLQVTSYGQRKCQPWCCATWSHGALMKGLRGCTSLENVGTRRVQEKMVLLHSQLPGRLLHQKHLVRKPWKKKSWMKAMRSRITSATRRNGRMQMMRARVTAQSPCNQALTNNNNKVVVGSSFWDMPKYMGEGVVLCGPLVSLTCPVRQKAWNFMIFGNNMPWHTSNVLHSMHIRNFNVILVVTTLHHLTMLLHNKWCHCTCRSCDSQL